MEVKPGYKQTEVGVIPEEWCVRPLLTTVRIASGQVSPKVEPYKSMVLVAPDHIESSTGRLLAKQTAEEQRAISGKYVFESGDIVYSKIRPYLRKAVLASFAGLCSADMYPLKPAADVSSGFIFATVLSYRFSKYAESVSVRSGMPKINRAELAEFTLGLPPLPEQRAIATALSDVDALLVALERLIAKKRDLKQATMQQLLTGQSRLPGFYGDWQVRLLGDLINSCSSGATPRRDQPDFYKGDIRWITSGELNYNVITDTVEKITSEAVAQTNLKVIPKGTFLMAITGLEAAGTRGSCAIVGEPSTTNQSCMAIFPTSELLTDYLFHYYVFRGDALALQYCQGSKQQSYTAKLVRKLPISVPPTTEEQTAIATVLSDMDDELAALEKRLAKTRALKQGMMQELLTGRTRLV
ncbi:MULTISPECIES: restriction endonuclease subunit S [Pseudomonas]|uniref:restriction endonuclease subunit S n=1 Tax=Pseudomonas TaxID=286 RepID=UPI000A1EA081|nr:MULTISPECIES: restriction endonuclease subunit S [Pseudomonas]MDH4429120.1 restriction endonuclease subunit S [Pseudomonas shirazica]